MEWEQALAPFDDFTLNGLEDANVALLQASVASEEHPARDKNDELLPLANELARLDFKLNLVLQLLGNLAPRRELPQAAAVKFNALGASWQPRGARSSTRRSTSSSRSIVAPRTTTSRSCSAPSATQPTAGASW